MLTSVRVDNVSDLTEWRSEWTAVLGECSDSTIFLSWEWIATWLRCFARSERDVHIVLVLDGAMLIGAVPLYIATAFWPSPHRALRICGSEELLPDYLEVLARPGREDDVIDTLHKYLAGVPWDVALFDDVLESSTMARLAERLRSEGSLQRRPSNVCSLVRVHGTFDQYLREQFGSKHRRNLLRQVRVALEDQGLTLHHVSHEEDVLPAMYELMSLHAKRQAAEGRISSFTAPEVAAFHREVAPLLFRAGMLSLWVLHHGKTPVSALYGFVYRGRFFFYQSGMDPDWARLSVGTVVLTSVIKECFDRGLVEFDFLKGSEAYKKSWATGERVELQLAVFRTGARALILRAVQTLRRHAGSIRARLHKPTRSVA